MVPASLLTTDAGTPSTRRIFRRQQPTQATTHHARWLTVTLVAMVVLNSAVAGALAASSEQQPAQAWDDQPTDVQFSTPEDLQTAVSAPHWFVLEVATGKGIFGHQWDIPRPVASAVKIATALTTVRRSAIDDTLVIPNEFPLPLGASAGISAGQTWTIEDLLEALIARSGNDAAEVVAWHVAGDRESFVEMMRHDLAALGLGSAVVSDPSGLDDANRFTAQQLAILGATALTDPELGPLLGRTHVDLPTSAHQPSRNLLLESYPGATGIKTGYTQQAGNVLVGSARRAKRELVVVVMDAHHDPARFDDAARLLDHTFATTQLAQRSPTLETRGGSGSVRWSTGPVYVTVPRGSVLDLTWPWPAYTPEGPLLVQVLVDGMVVEILEAERHLVGGNGNEQAAGLGSALADGVYAALRSAAVHDALR
ncbi:MAG: hypothetical protein WD007_00795 [Nitriliruptoraceae bacterium]